MFQSSGNYLTNASSFQSAGDYLTTFTPLSGTYLSILDASSTYQSIANMSSYVTSGSLTDDITIGTTLLSNYNTTTTTNSILSNYITSGSLTKANVGLGNVDNTSDANKPVSVAMQNLLSNYPTIGTTLLSNYNTTTTTNSMLNSYLTKPWVGGRFNASLTTLSTIGQQSFTLSKPATGTYNVNWTTANPSGSTYAISVSVRGPLTASYGLPGANGFQLYAYSVGTSVLMDIPQDISFFTLP